MQKKASKHLRSGLHDRFCRCIKAVRSQKPGKTRKQKKAAEKSAIAICVSSVIQRLPRRTLHSFRCKNTRKHRAFIKTQKVDKN